MKNNIIYTLMLATALLAVNEAKASKLKVINTGLEPIYIYFKGKGNSDYYVQSHAANITETYKITNEMLNGRNAFEVIASKSGSGNPDIKLLAGSCNNLLTERDYLLRVEPGFKTSCEVLSEK